ncbi:TetR/AcrR family transcriptional regulator [Hufsiella ginkgonis]|uniref:TetR family transcriptional regulator n=1 Tax=Hufsiella ginkgonis TaxID=2695274 RepID=A0A7K1XWT5_9SPHI|nr:TetR family transcriptional regulator [Hufsiella ginkgonis]
MDIKQHILKESDQLFCRYGIKSVTMDDIAKHLGMSKKTIYQHFQDKDELVYILIKNKMEQQTCSMDDTAANAENAVHEVFLAVTQMEVMLSNMNPMLFYDLQKYHPEAWQVFRSFREKNLYQTILNNIDRGIREGYYRETVNRELIAAMRVEQIDMVLSPLTFAAGKYSMLQVMAVHTEHFVYGVCNLRGHRLINSYKNINEQ